MTKLPGRPILHVPDILDTYIEGGVKYYRCEGGRTYVAETYDYFFKVEKTPVKPRTNKNKSSRSVSKRPNSIKGGV